MKASDNVFPKVLFGEAAAPAAPATGEVVMYAKTDGKLYSKDDAGTETALGGGGGGSGDVVGPASSVDSHVALFDGTTGKLLKDGGALGGMAGINDAPSDGTGYVRKSGAWVAESGGGGGTGAVDSVNGDTGAVIVAVPIIIACSDETTALTTGTAKTTFRMPYAFTLTDVRASLTGPAATGTITVDINEAGSSILSTKLTIDATEKTSTTAATPPVISDTALADDAEITIDLDDDADGAATGLKVTLIGYAP